MALFKKEVCIYPNIQKMSFFRVVEAKGIVRGLVMAHERSVRWFNFVMKQEERKRREVQRILREQARQALPINGNGEESEEEEKRVEALMESQD